MVLDFVAESPATRRLDELRNAFIFRFPPLMEGARIIYFNIRSYPSPLWKPTSVPFFTARHHRLCVVTIYTRMPTIQAMNLFVLGDTFLSLTKNIDQRPAYFDWQAWGPDGTRIINCSFLSPFTFDVHGTRYACTMQQQAEHVYIYDFNQLALKWAQKNATTEEESSEVSMSYVNVTMPTTLRGGEIFQYDVETRLGYRVKRLSIPREPRVCVHCSEDGIVIEVSLSEQQQTLY